MDPRWALLALFAALLVPTEAIGSKWNITVRGQLKCKNKNVANKLVELWDKESIKKDDLLESFTTEAQGHFFIVGYETQISKIKPYIRIKHECGATAGCHKVTEIAIDQMWVGKQKDLAFVYLDKDSTGKTDEVMTVREECPPRNRALV
ncbi:hypothetical protein PRIPAC_79458 [Pristionchus pacificus]|uniref:Uncharacterized protein n=1 Tax=Pristionchus pacificus TaxID=54126 RepID=A0A2A6BXS0_PRIPA|nr:hypothetical protein PRIPAC_79458 [Pristionchus pacificus]|eukprot:PDM70627.1 hypothetical protein PRIPAC_46873 [Pristionchus pacificus]